MAKTKISELKPPDKMCWWKMQHRKHRTKVRCFHIFIIFFAAKSFKNSFFKKQFFPRQATFSRCSRLILWTDATRTPKHGCFTLAATWRISLLSHIWAKKNQRKRMHASGVRPLPLAPWPRWAAWSYYSSANIALPWHCSSLWQGISPFHQRTMPYSGKKGEESQESLSWSDQ